MHTSPLLIRVCALIGLATLAFSLVCWAIATRRTNRHKRAIDAHFRNDMRGGDIQLVHVITEEGLTGDQRARALALIQIEQAMLRIEQAQLDSLRYKPSNRKR